DQERARREQADQARAVEPVQDAGQDLVPQRPADLAVDRRLAQVLRRHQVGRLDGVGPALPPVVLQTPAETLHTDGRHRDLDTVIDGRGQPRLDAAHAETDHADALRVNVGAGL